MTHSRSALRLAAAAALLLAPAGPARAADDRPTEVPYETPGDFPTLSPEYQKNSPRAVIISANALNPRLVRLEEGEVIAWISYSAVPSVIVFEREVARSMICHSLVNFSIKDDELRSAPIHAGEFASFCQLKPGRYRYKVVRPQAGQKSIDAAGRLEGEIIVGEPEKG
jgi:hypothetical protein